MDKTYVAIMAGGIGSRFWPHSRSSHPKQFLDILNIGKTLIQMTYERFLQVTDKERIFIVTNEAYAATVKEQLKGISDDQILKEPYRRNTAPCVAYIANKIQSIDPDANIIVSPADHVILQEAKFFKVIKKAADYVSENDNLVTLGIKPTRPDTGYGYIQYIEDANDKQGVFKVKTFTEKPTKEIAESFIDSGDFLWNSGMFVWNVKTILNAFKEHLPEVGEAFQSNQPVYGSPKESGFIKKAYSLCKNISIDYAIMEKAENVRVIPSEFGWSDVGTWGSLYGLYEKDYLGNAVRGNAVKVYNSSNNMVVVPDNKLVILQGMKDFIIIDTNDVLLICEKENEQEIKKYTTDLKRSKLDQYL